jgi:hypothetical protein
MARKVAPYSLLGLALVFIVFIVALPLAKTYLSPYTLSGGAFGDLSCKAYAKPCPEGFFCQQETCTPIFPK